MSAPKRMLHPVRLTLLCTSMFLVAIAAMFGFTGRATAVLGHETGEFRGSESGFAPVEQSSNCGVSYYRVKRGDTLAAIARRAGTSSRAIRQCNGLSSNVIYAGQVLSIPGVVRTTEATPQSRVSRSYTPALPSYAPSVPQPRQPDQSSNPYYRPQRPTPVPGR